ncbi:MAG: sensor histidine kinase [Velocimicrobium sp.]
MRKRITGYAQKYRNLPMQKKMIYAYSIPVIFICIIVNLLCFPIFSNKYEKQLRYTVNQSCSQADNFVSNYIENMYYISQLIADNGTIEDSLQSADFNRQRTLGEQYREFWKLADELADIELSNATYRIGLYIPDRLIYSNNNYYFYKESSLKKRDDYEQIMEKINANKLCFALIDESKSSGLDMVDTYIALFQKIHIMNEEKEEKTYVSKVEVPIDELQIVLEKARSTPKSLVYLLDESGKLLLSSDKNYFEKLQGDKKLPSKKIDSWTEYTLDGVNYYVVYQEVKSYNWKIFSLIPKEEFRGQSRFIWLMVLLMTILISVAVAVVSYRLSHYYVQRLSNLTQKMKNLESGDLSVSLVLKSSQSGDEIDEIYSNFNYMANEVRRLMKEHYRLGKNVMSAELKALQAQINPHFLYNTLDLINWGAMDYGATEVAQIARNLGQFYRLSLNHGKSAICISDELKHVEAYIKIENVHFDNAINLVIDVPEEIKQYACLNIILQPFVENAIVHGIAKYSEITECNITISARIVEQDILFNIRDDGYGIEEEKLSGILENCSTNANNGYGVKNINFRVKLCYGDKYGIAYKSIVGVGTEVQINIPTMTLEQLETLLQ